MFHLSDIKKYTRCSKYFHLSKRLPQPYFPYAYCNQNTMELCKTLLNITEFYEGLPNDPKERALEALSKYNVLINARFTYEDLRVTIPFLLKNEDGYSVIFPFNQCYPKESEAIRLANAVWILKQNNIEVKKVSIIRLNAQYIRQDHFDINECLIIDDHLYNDKNKGHRSVMELINHYMQDLGPILAKMRQSNEDDAPSERSSVCTHHGKCIYFDTCFNFSENPTSIYHLVQSQQKYEMFDKGIKDLSMVDPSMIEGTRHQYAQIMAAQNKGMFIDKSALKIWIKNRITYPITYLDFEWETYVYPPYKGMKPYDVLVFQYSMDIEKKHQGNLHHEEYIGTKDCRREFIENLLSKIPKSGSIMVFNAVGAEKLRLQQLAQQFPEYKKQLQAVWERMVDLSIPFSSGNIYDIRMAGAYSLKKLVTLFSDFKYSDLEISHGMEAVKNWRDLGDESLESESIKQALFQYCAMDTYSMVIVFHKIIELIS